MRIIEPRKHHRRRHANSHPLLRWLSLSGALLIIGYSSLLTFRYYRPLPTLTPETKNISLPAEVAALNLPGYGQVAISAVGYGQLAKSGDDAPRPIASVAKVVSALTVLQKKPLTVGQAGPVLTLDAQDVAFYDDYISRDGSVVRVAVGEQLTEYQALQALLLPSANNIADSLARWSYGSVDAFVAAANDFVANQGLTVTSLADASGYSPKTVSTARDLVRLGELAMRQPVIAEIVGQSSAVIPIAGEIKNVNVLLGNGGIDGIKTGNTDEAGGCFLTTIITRPDTDHPIRLIVAVLGASNLAAAMQDAQRLLTKTSQNFSISTIKAGTVVGYYNVPWGQRIAAVTTGDLRVVRWQGTAVRAEIALNNLSKPLSSQATVGTLKAIAGPNNVNVSLKLQQAVPAPNWRWRFWRAVAL